ncbi:MAG: sensor histidine kinase [Cellulosilyticaceae bacterium]
MSIGLGVLLTSLFMYVVFQIGSIQKGKLKNTVMVCLMLMVLIGTSVTGYPYVGTMVATVLVMLFDLFYDEEPFFKQWKWLVGYGIGMSILASFVCIEQGAYTALVSLGMLGVTYFLLGFYRKLLKWQLTLMMVMLYSIYGYVIEVSGGREWWMVGAALLTFGAMELVFKSYHTSFERKTSHFQQQLLLSQYEEIKNVYLNMRGFRHDYHNHLQVMKAHLHMGQIGEMEQYLQQLEGELQRIDNSVRSGNVMLDAILNSKVTLAEQAGIEVNCKAEVPETLPVSDIDLCIILGNLLDNAIEACEKINEGRFMRIYIATFKNQLYLSIQNAAKEELDFNERHYISAKRGNHGLGMKRVKVLVEKYEGYMNLQNESGVFAAEVTLPL